jgi:type I restriction enzyme S subunit
MTQVRPREAQQILESMVVARYQMYPEYRDTGIEWLGEIPAHWEVRRLKFLANDINQQKVEIGEDEVYLQLENIEGWTGRYTIPEDTVSNFESTAKAFQPDDVLFGKLRPYLAKVIVSKHYGACVGELLVLRVRENTILPKFLALRLLTREFIDVVDASTYGAKMPRANWGFIGNLEIPFPPDPDEQRAITVFLDRQTAKIDALIAKKRELIAALHEKRSAIISHAVTKGLNPDAPMKDSGIEWVDSIPAHWQVQRLKFVADVRSGVAKGRKFEGVKTVELPYLRVANVQAGRIDLSDIAEIEVTVSEIERYSLKVGDVLMNEGGDYDKLGRGAVWQGQIEPCLHQNHVFAVRPHQQCLSSWITTLTLAQYARFYFMINSKQSTNLASISSRNLSEFPVILPPKSEREQILAYIKGEAGHIDGLIAKTEETIERLQEYRAALISAAVTGKIDVRRA